LGAWLSCQSEQAGRPSYGELWHPEVANQVKAEFPDLERYFGTQAAPSPAYHGAISAVLNGLSLDVFPAVVEQAFSGKILYAGGDDLLAMVSVRDLLPLLLALRCVFSGELPKARGRFVHELSSRLDETASAERPAVKVNNGYVQMRDRVYRAMGPRA